MWNMELTVAVFAFLYLQIIQHLGDIWVWFPPPSHLVQRQTKKTSFTDKYMETLIVTRLSVLNIDTKLNAKA